MRAAFELRPAVQVYAAEAQAAKLKPEPVEPPIAKLVGKSAELKSDPVKPTTADRGYESAKLKSEPVESTTANHGDETVKLKSDTGESTTAKHEDNSAKLKSDPVEQTAAKYVGKDPAKQAEDVWNERIKSAYAAVAASTPYRPAPKKPSSNALSWHRSARHPLNPPASQCTCRPESRTHFCSAQYPYRLLFQPKM